MKIKLFLQLYICFFQAARELAEKASNQQSDRETGTAATALVGSAASEPSTVPANQSSAGVGLMASSTHDALANPVPPGAGSSHNVDNTSSSSVVGMQNGGPSTAVSVTTSSEVQLVATDAGNSRFLQIFMIFQPVIMIPETVKMLANMMHLLTLQK